MAVPLRNRTKEQVDAAVAKFKRSLRGEPEPKPPDLTPEDWKNSFPEPKVKFDLAETGRGSEEFAIGSDDEEELDPCPNVCEKKHPCKGFLDKPCPPCKERVNVRHTRCRHIESMLCYEAVKNGPCNVFVRAKNKASCGHFVDVPCYKWEMEKRTLTLLCKTGCEKVIPVEEGGCGHKCPGGCGSCFFGLLHARCETPCGANLICGHVCNFPCNAQCPPCQRACELSCAHGECPAICGYPCQPCPKPCPWVCPHKECTKMCGEVCDRDPCNKPCPKKLKCGHKCVGFCGEPCPSLCRVCNHAKLLECVSVYTGQEVVDESDRFIRLHCSHIMEVKTMEAMLNTKDETGEIVLKMCPICRKGIFNIPRFSKVLAPLFQDILNVKRNIYGTEEEIQELRGDIRQYMYMDGRHFNGQYEGKGIYPILGGDFYRATQLIEFDKTSYLYGKFYASSLKYLVKTWRDIEWKIHMAKKGNTPEEFKLFKWFYGRFFTLARSRPLPFLASEYHDLNRELKRLNYMAEIYQKKADTSTTVDKSKVYLTKTKEAREAQRVALLMVTQHGPFTEAVEAETKRAIENFDKSMESRVKLSEAEKDSIVVAFGKAQGRWFKCKNGHPYVVTECGGPTQIGFCNVCGALIGGESHHLVEDNALATEMDGATSSLYPNVA